MITGGGTSNGPRIRTLFPTHAAYKQYLPGKSITIGRPSSRQPNPRSKSPTSSFALSRIYARVRIALLPTFDSRHSTHVMERTLILLKPDCVQRRLMGRVIARFEDKALNTIAMKMMRVTPELAK